MATVVTTFKDKGRVEKKEGSFLELAADMLLEAADQGRRVQVMHADRHSVMLKQHKLVYAFVNA